MTQDFVQRLLNVLAETPRESWERRLRAEFGGAEHYVARRSPPRDSGQIQELVRAGVAARTARYKVRGR